MKNHVTIDRRGLALAAAVVRKLESGDFRAGVMKARSVNARWRSMSPSALHDEWMQILERDWTAIRAALLDDSEQGCRLRQNNPFCGILTPQERWAIFKEFQQNAA